MENGSGVAVGEGPHGRGVFATRAFAKGEVVESCPTVELADADVTGRLNDYVFSSVNEGDVLLVLGLGMLFNHGRSRTSSTSRTIRPRSSSARSAR